MEHVFADTNSCIYCAMPSAAEGAKKPCLMRNIAKARTVASAKARDGAKVRRRSLSLKVLRVLRDTIAVVLERSNDPDLAEELREAQAWVNQEAAAREKLVEDRRRKR